LVITNPSIAPALGDPIIPRRYSKNIKNAAIPNTPNITFQGMHFFLCSSVSP